MKTIAFASGLLFLAASLHGQGQQPDVQLTITEPVQGETYRSVPVFRGALLATAGREYDVQVRCFQTTHWLLCTQKRPYPPKVNAAGQVTHHLRDEFLLPETGDHVMEIEVYELRNGLPVDPDTPISRARVAFSFEPATREELAPELADRSQNLCRGALGKTSSTLFDPHSRHPQRNTLKEYQQKITPDAKYYVSNRNRAFFAQTDAYASAAQILEKAGHPGEGLRALRTAEEIYEAEKNTLISVPGLQDWPIIWEYTYPTSPPDYTRSYYYFYARRGELEQATRWQQKRADFWLRQGHEHPAFDADRREDCIKRAARHYDYIARLHYVLNRDRSGWDSWIRKREKTYPSARDQAQVRSTD